MKSVVFLNDLKESDIRPENVYDEYKRLLDADAAKYFADMSRLKEVDCPGCSGKNSTGVFKRSGFEYRSCKSCGTLFVSPRPTDEMIRAFYRDSAAGKFLRDNVLKNTSESRAEKIFSYRIQWITGLLEEYSPGAKDFLEYGTKYPAFLSQLDGMGVFKTISSVFPECYGQEGLFTRNIKIAGKGGIASDSVDMFAAFEAVEKAFEPGALFREAFRVCRKNGLFIVSSATSSGFEYQLLGGRSPNVVFPDRMNLLSLEALTGRIKDAGFEVIEVSTPGRLDVEIVRRAYEKDRGMPLDPFWKYLMEKRDKNALHALQDFLQQFQLSSHVRVAAIKR